MSTRFGKKRALAAGECRCEHNYTCGPCLRVAGPTPGPAPMPKDRAQDKQEAKQ